MFGLSIIVLRAVLFRCELQNVHAARRTKSQVFNTMIAYSKNDRRTLNWLLRYFCCLVYFIYTVAKMEGLQAQSTSKNTKIYIKKEGEKNKL